MSTNPPAPAALLSDTPAPTTIPQDLIICVFIHGFKGNDTSFHKFPQRIQELLGETLEDATVESIVFPAYETKGSLTLAVENFVDWLTGLVVEREVAHGMGGGAGKARVVLCGHSMGGLLAAEAIVAIATSRPDSSAPLWPRIIACIAFDTPYYGVHPFVFKNSATKAVDYVQAAQKVASGFGMLGSLTGFGKKSTSAPTPSVGESPKTPTARSNSQTPTDGQLRGDKKGKEEKDEGGPSVSAGTSTSSEASTSIWNKYTPSWYGIGGALLVGAVAGAAYYRRNDVELGWDWVSDHMKFVGALWEEKALKTRVERLLDVGREHEILFRNYYTLLPADPPEHVNPRTFVILPPLASRPAPYFIAAENGLARDQIAAHVGMFEPTGNAGYDDLERRTVEVVSEAVRLSGLRAQKAFESRGAS